MGRVVLTILSSSLFDDEIQPANECLLLSLQSDISILWLGWRPSSEVDVVVPLLRMLSTENESLRAISTATNSMYILSYPVALTLVFLVFVVFLVFFSIDCCKLFTDCVFYSICLRSHTVPSVGIIESTHLSCVYDTNNWSVMCDITTQQLLSNVLYYVVAIVYECN